MAEVEITHEEVRGIDINQVASMQLKDGTVVVVKTEEELAQEGGDVCENCQEGEYAQEDIAQEEDPNQYAEGYYEEEQQQQTNDLRARPMMMARPIGVPMVPVRRSPMPPMMAPPRPIIPSRGPVRPMGMGMGMGYGLLRARPGMPVYPNPVHHAPKVAPVPVPVRPVAPVVPGRVLPVKKPVVPVVPMRPPVTTMPVRPVPVPGKKPLVSPMVKAPGVFRSRPTNVEEEQDFQEEYAGEEQYCQCDEQQCQEECAEDNQLRARPLAAPVRPIVHKPVVPVPVHRPVVPVVPAPVVPKPHVVPRPAVVPVPVGVPKRGPVVPVAYNTYQPKVFRARPGYRPVAPPMVPVNTTFQPMVAVPKPHHHPPRGPMRPVVPGRAVPVPVPMGGVFRNRPDAQEGAEECQQNAECTKTCVCSKCGKEF